ncbi:Calx-beta domain protein [Novipirellula aureliae]|uniref:Calx-beta domain protein n=1 Tax=Novipirellula aureliae TaxID=2527966 RepID=A0A5C6DGC5_9BACT|nr:Calx-beta domain-containing protein [Novipirellula aureliae]TWU35778.1 Calx-beta domain protein [Novipirellula aureliae]
MRSPRRKRRRLFRLETLERRDLLAASVWQNSTDRFDVNNDAVYSSGDLIPIFAEVLNHNYSDANGRLPDERPSDDNAYFFDVSGDGFVTHLDLNQMRFFLGASDFTTYRPNILSVNSERQDKEDPLTIEDFVFGGAMSVTVDSDYFAGSVDVATEDIAGQAVAGVDYTSFSTTLSFDESNDYMESFSVDFIADATPEPDETFAVTLSNLQPGEEGPWIFDQTLVYDTEFSTASTANLSSAATDVNVQDTTAYVTDGDGVHVFSIFDVSNPLALGSLTGLGDTQAIQVVDFSTAYIAAGEDGLIVMDVTNPAMMMPLGSLPTTADVYDVYYLDGRLYTAEGNDGAHTMRIYDASDPAALVELGRTVTPEINQLIVQGTVAYAAASDGGLILLDVADPSSITMLDSDNTLNAQSIDLRDTTLYVGATDSVKAYDVSDPSNIVLLGSIDSGTNVSFSLSGEFGYFGDEIRGFGGLLYATESDGLLKVYNVSNPSEMVLVGSFAVTNPRGLDLAVDRVFLAADSGLQVLTQTQIATVVGTILNDDEGTPTVFFTSDGQFVREVDGSVSVEFTLSAASDTPIVVPISYSGTADDGTDYSSGGVSEISIPAGDTSASLSLSIIDDEVAESSETIVVSMGTPSGAVLGSVTEQTITITDDDVNATPTVQFTADAQNASESDGSISVSVMLSAASDTEVVVPLSYSGTADDGTDYSSSGASQITIPAGDTSASVSLSISDDDEVEPAETIIVSMGTPSGADLGTTSEQTITITDNDVTATPTVQFTADAQNASESDGSINVSVMLSAASNTEVVVPLSYSGTADDGTDYSSSGASQITIPAGDTSASVSLSITDDDEVEPAETIIVSMGTPSGADLGTTSEQTITITDDDATATPTVQFASATQNASESDGSISVSVTLSAASDTEVVVPLSYSGTADDGTDYSSSGASQITIPVGDTSAGVSLSITDDDDVEPAETIIVSMGTPSGVNLGSTSEQTITINDNDVTVPTDEQVVVSRGLVTGPALIPAGDKAVVHIFGAKRDTELTVTAIGRSSVNGMPTVHLYDADLGVLADNRTGSITATLDGGKLYAIRFEATDAERLFSIRSSAGYDALFQTPITNLIQRTDVDASGETTANDALMIVNRLSESRSAQGESLSFANRFYDVSGDGIITALDALMVINFLSEGSRSVAESESIPLAANGIDNESIADSDVFSDEFAIVAPEKKVMVFSNPDPSDPLPSDPLPSSAAQTDNEMEGQEVDLVMALLGGTDLG